MLRFGVGSVVLPFFLLLTCAAQEFRSTLQGVVEDGQGAVVPGAKVVATGVATGVNHETVSGEDGRYVLPFLPPGDYRIAAEATGFKRYVRENFHIGTNERPSLTLQLEVGQISESVTITAEASALETSTASTGQVISSRQIENMPMNGRTPLVLAQLAFGVVPSSDPRFYRPFDNAGPSQFSMGGAPSNSNELLIDGAPDTTRNNRVAYNPPVDAVEEVKVETFMADAAYGHTGGGTVNVVMKSGTNDFHGTAYEFNQISNTAANQFFNNRAGLPRPTTRFNQFGANGGGPFWIPKVINTRNRAFFYVGYERVSDALPTPVQSTVPTAAERNGDFSQLLNVNSTYQIYDPLTGAREGTRVRRQPFVNNIIPTSRLSPIARRYLDLYPQPNQAGRADGQNNFISPASGERNAFHNVLGRLDLVLSSRHKLFWNIRNNERKGTGFNALGYQVGSGPAGDRQFKRENWGSTLDDVFSISPTMVINTRLNWTRFVEGNTNLFGNFDVTGLGLPASIAANARQTVLPRLQFSQFSGIGSPGSQEDVFDIFQIFSSVTKVTGKHNLKFGTDLRLYRESSFNFGDSSGRFAFGPDWTRGPLDNSPNAPLGQDLAAFMLGLPTGGQFDLNAHRTNQAGYYGLFIQDDIRVNSSLTLNLGLRYERPLPTVERYNRSVNGFDATTANPIDAQARAAYARNPIEEIPVGQFRALGGLLFASESNRNVYNTKANNFSPRIGFAWTPAALGRKTVIRGGGGVFFFGQGTLGINQPGFSQDTQLVASLDGFLTPNATFANPFPNGFVQPTGSSRGLATFLGRDAVFYNPNPSNSYSTRWLLSVQRELSPGTVIEVGYMGNRSNHLEVGYDFNFTPEQYLSKSPDRDQPAIDRLTARVSNPFAGLIPGTALNGSVVSRATLLQTFPHFTRVFMQENTDGSSYFHMFQVRFEKRYNSGLSILGNYQWSKLIERRSRLNGFSGLEKRIAGEDRPQRFVLSFSYDLPFGKGKPLGSSVGPWTNRLIGGWILNGIYTWQPGAPVNWGNLIYFGGDLNWDPRNIDRVFDVSRFNREPTQQLQNNVRTFPSRFANLRQDGANNFDFSVLKDIPIWERVKLQFRTEFFNGFNHPAFDPPQLNPTNRNFGTVIRQSNVSRRLQMALRLNW
ncbi:MAG: carboxypeptidase regulatory-like domain-containing protein [Bryobacteraceae bacterium]|nr:carboxypeptidase regulatory-like domain-containing protein [Bryobacteraceae bacterium]